MDQNEHPIVARSLSRYGVERVIRKIDENTFTIEGESLYTRGTTCNSMADFEGGPYVEVGMAARYADIPENRTIVALKFIQEEREHFAKVEVKLKPKS